jgi:hypothetical protein
MQIGTWMEIENKKDYIVWQKPPRPGFNTFSVVVKTEDGQWVSFVSASGAGSKLLNRGGSKAKNIKVATKYMKAYPR